MPLDYITARGYAPVATNERGFALLEVLVAIIIMGIGLLGLASLQVTGQRDNHTAYLRSQAVLQAYDMTDRMRANLVGVDAGGYNSVSGIPDDPGCISTGCTPAQLAQYDAREWNTTNQLLLPSGQGTIAFNAASSTFTIAVAWDENRDGLVDNQDPTFSLELSP